MEEPIFVPIPPSQAVETIDPSTPEGYVWIKTKIKEIKLQRSVLEEEERRIQKICPHRDPNGQVLLRRKKSRRKDISYPIWQCSLCGAMTDDAVKFLASS